ncbi:hypothetical protein LPTSP4_20740 [Leptospira ryugenii]|uniref:Lipoprotein n=1 Tax=Leptospira ryugenii TaxID=1917863 RepID=A0A2P2E0Y0_9LEPT|nr:hypothetical protein [Leptospira ryugenii]GBF50548.1 hypothetical protein LPTSP4_20740 [Leptospira ryugenii]
MKRHILKLTGIALVSSLTFTACHPDKIKDEPALAAVLASTIASAASGACLLNVNGAGLYYGSILFNTVNNLGGAGFTLADYNAATGSNLNTTQFGLLGYEEKFRAFFLDNGTAWTTSLRNTRLAAVKTNMDNGTFGVSLQALQQLPGTGVMACARIPRTSCSLSGLTTATRAADITANIATYNSVVNNPDCRKPGSTFPTMLAKYLFRGTPSTELITLSGGNIFNTPTNGVPTTAGAGINVTATILPEGMYPKFGALVSQGFGNLMPINKLGKEYPTSTSSSSETAFYGGTNLSVQQVISCDAYGFGYGVTADAPESLRKPLTSPAEVAYSFSTNGQAANAYQAAVQLTTIDQDSYITTATAGNIQDAVACNNSFRARQGISQALGGGKLPTTNGGAQSLLLGDGRGDDRATSLLGLCIYGGNTTKRTVLQGAIGGTSTTGLIGAGLLTSTSQVSVCGEGSNAFFRGIQSEVATAFKEVGTFTTFPNSN